MRCTHKSGRNSQEENNSPPVNFSRLLLKGADPEDNSYKGIMCFIIAGLKENVPFVVKNIPETGVTDAR